jgi:hypothetical protein
VAIQLSTSVRNARLDQFEATVGIDPKLHIVVGSQPATCAASDTGSVLAIMTLPTDWLAVASSGTKAIAGTWQIGATGAGVAGHFRIFNSGSTECHMQGSVGQGSGDLSLDNTTIASAQTVTITAFTLPDGNG